MKRQPTSLVAIVLVLLLVLLGGNQFLKTDAAPEVTAPIITAQGVAAYLFEHGTLPDNFITKKEAEALGWDSRKNHLSDVAPGKSIGGDHYGNYEKVLPEEKGRTWTECDINYVEGPRNAYRICYSSDGLVYYSDDHYKTFTQMEKPTP